MKICIISTNAYTLFNPKFKGKHGGAEVQLYLISQELAKLGLDLNMFVGDVGQPDIEHIKGVTLIKMYSKLNSKYKYVTGSIQFMYNLIKLNPDVVICRTKDPIIFFAALYCRLFGKKLIYSAAHINNFEPMKFNLFDIMYHIGLKASHKLVVQTQDQYNLAKHNSINLIKNSFNIKPIKRNDKCYMLWVGRSIPFKQPELFLELAKSNPDKQFVMIMNKNDKHEKLYYDIVEQSKLIPNLKFIPKVPFNRINNYFNEAKVLINTSESEGFPNTFIQSCLNYTPILSLTFDPDNFLDKFNCGTECYNSLQFMNLYLNYLFKNDKKYNEMCVNARQYVEQEHDIKSIIKQWYDLCVGS